MADFLSKKLDPVRVEVTEKTKELVLAIIDIPQISIFQNLQTEKARDSFKTERYENILIAERIYCRGQGIEPRLNVPEDVKDLVRAYSAFYNAEYNLVFECWDKLNIEAKRDNLIPANGQPKDFYKLLLEERSTYSYDLLDADKRDEKTQMNSQQKRIAKTINLYKKCKELNNKIANLVIPVNDPTKTNSENREIFKAYNKSRSQLNCQHAALQRSWMGSYHKSGRCYQLFLTVFYNERKKSSVIATDFYISAIQDKNEALSKYFRNPFLESLKK
jgi:hypothetical protein